MAHWDKASQRVILTIPGDPFFQAETFSSDIGTFVDVTRDRLVLGNDAAGNPVIARLLKPGKAGGLPDAPTVAITGAAEPLSFGSYLTDPTVFPDHAELNEILYATTRGVDPKGYRFVGFARAHGTAFIGVLYMNYAPSDQRRGRNGFRFLLFRLAKTQDKKGVVQWVPYVVPQPSGKGALPDPPLPKGANDWEEIDPLDGDPLLDVAYEDGDLYLVSGEHLWRRSADGIWKDTGSIRLLLPPTPPRKADYYGWVRYNQVYLRGRWLIVLSLNFNDATRNANRASRPNAVARVFDVTSRQLVRSIEWPLSEVKD